MTKTRKRSNDETIDESQPTNTPARSPSIDDEVPSQHTPLPQPISVTSQTHGTDPEPDENSPATNTHQAPRLVTIPETELAALQQLANAVRAGDFLARMGHIPTNDPGKVRTFSTKNIKIEKFCPDTQRNLIDYGLTRWLEHFNRELEFELKAQHFPHDDEIKKMTLFRFMKGKAADYTRQMARTFQDMTYPEVETQLKEKYTRIMSREKRDQLIQLRKRKDGEESDEYLSRLITIADSMPEGRSSYEDIVLGTFIKRADSRYSGQMRYELTKMERGHATFDDKCTMLLRMLEAYTEDENRSKADRRPNHHRPYKRPDARALHTSADEKFKDAVCTFKWKGKECGTKGHTFWYHRRFFPKVPKLTQADIDKRRAQIQRSKETTTGNAHSATNASPAKRHKPADTPTKSDDEYNEQPTEDGEQSSESDNDSVSSNDSGHSYQVCVANTEPTDDHHWGIDTCASFHMTGNKQLFEELKLATTKKVRVANATTDDGILTTTLKGNIHLVTKGSDKTGRTKWHEWTLENVRYVPGLSTNLISVSQLLKGGHLATIAPKEINVTTKKGAQIFNAPVQNGIYIAHSRPCTRKYTAFLVSQVEDTEENWHKRLGHLNYGHLRKLLKHGTATGIKIRDKKRPHEGNCEICQIGKIKRAKIAKQATRPIEEQQRVGSVDCVGPLKPQSVHHNTYIFFHTFKNYIEINFGKRKDQAKKFLKEWVERIDRQHGANAIQTVRSDNGGEYQNNETIEYLKNKGIQMEYTEPRTPHQNGLAERKHQVVLDMIRTMLEDSGLPSNLWEYAASYAVYILNRTYTKALPEGKSAYENRFNKVPDLRHLRSFGETCVYKKQLRKKLEAKGRKGRFIGIDLQRKGYKILDVKTKKVINTKDVVFTAPNRTQEQELQLEDVEVEAHNANDPRQAVRRSTRIRNKNIGHAFLILAEQIREPLTIREALQGPHQEQWRIALITEIKALNANHTWTRVRRPPKANIIKTKWVLKIKYDADGRLEKFKARLVAKGFKQKFLVDYFETYSPVASKESLRVFLAVVTKRKLKMKQYDVPSAYVKANLEEEIFIELPEGFQGKDGDLGRPTPEEASPDERPDDVLKLIKGLYGLKQAGRAWYREVTQTLKGLGLQPLESDPCLFICSDGDKVLLLLLYVDDILIATNWDEKFTEVANGLKEAYGIKELGEVRHFLGMKIEQRDGGIFISQENFVSELIRRFELEGVAPRHTPLDGGEMFLDSDTEEATSVPYRQIVGALLYVSTCSRPDIAFATSQAAKFASKPRAEHWNQLMKICGYIKATAHYGLWFRSSDQDMEVYSDADWANDIDTRKSVSGVMIKAWGCPVVWVSKKQPIVATSTKAAETIAACLALQKADGVRELLEEMKCKNDDGMTIQIDNQPAIDAINRERPVNATKHLSIKYHFIKERVKTGEIDLAYIESKNQIADVFTKSLPRQQFERLRKMLKVVPNHKS